MQPHLTTTSTSTTTTTMAAGSTGGEGAGYLRAVLELDDRHASVVAGIAASVRSRPADKRLSVRKASTKSHTPHDKSVKKNCHLVDISGLDRVLRYVAAVLFSGGLILTTEALLAGSTMHGKLPSCKAV